MSERFILMPPAVHAIVALASRDDEEQDGIPDYGNRNLAGVNCKRDGDIFTAEATNGRMAGRYVADVRFGHAEPEVVGSQFPNLDTVMPMGKPVLTVRVDPGYLIALLQACQAVGNGEPVDMHFYGPDKVMKVHVANECRKREFTGLLVPCAPKTVEKANACR